MIILEFFESLGFTVSGIVCNIVLLSILLFIHYLFYMGTVYNVTYMEYKNRYKSMFRDWTLIFFIITIIPFIATIMENIK